MSFMFWIIFIIISFFLMMKFIPRFNIKITGIILFILALCVTSCICIVKPVMHKPVSLNIIEYFFRINEDGSVTRTKQVTKTIYDKK